MMSFETSNFHVEDFSDRNFNFENYKAFDLNIEKKYMAFNQLYNATEKGAVAIQVHEDVCLSDCIATINKHYGWLNSDDCKNQLIHKFCEFVSSYSGKLLMPHEVINNNWYDGLEINSVLITIPPDCEKMNFCICVVDKWHVLYIEMEEGKIISVFDEYANPEHGLGYDGVW